MTREEQINAAAEVFSSNDILSFGGACEELGCGFQEGAKWADKNPINVWHEASEEPQGDWGIVILDKYGEFFSYTKEDVRYIYEEKHGWKTFIEGAGLIKWAYISDLLPKE